MVYVPTNPGPAATLWKRSIVKDASEEQAQEQQPKKRGRPRKTSANDSQEQVKA